MKELRLGGCQGVTDVGLKWLSRLVSGCPRVEKLCLDGCRQVTEHGISQFLMPHASRTLVISAHGTGVLHSLKDTWFDCGLHVQLSSGLVIDADESYNGKL